MEEYCDNCAEQNPDYFINSMPVEFESGNVGESASLCQACFISLTKAKLKDGEKCSLNLKTEV
jgi:hypothetical protein